MESYFRNKSFVKLITKWKYHLIVIAVVAAVASYAATFLITEKYESFAVVYPANISPASEESETEQMLEIIQSQDIRNRVFESFDLISHYEIDTTKKGWYSKLNNEFEGNVSFTKTENEAVMINVIDKESEIAWKMVDSIIVFYNQKVKSLHNIKSYESLVTWRNEVAKKQHQMDSLEDRLKEIQKEYGLLEYNIQVEEYMDAMLEGRNVAESKEWLENVAEVGHEYRQTDSLLWETVDRYKIFKRNYESHIRDYNRKLTYTHVITAPYEADKSSYPKRLIYVIAGMFGALIFSLLVLSLIESKKEGK